MNRPFCATIQSIDDTTTTIGHEFAETVTDPFLFFGWSDPTKQPFYSKSEVADICEGLTAPWVEQAIVVDTALGTYWSNTAGGCVPETQPEVTILEPALNAAIATVNGQVVLRGPRRTRLMEICRRSFNGQLMERRSRRLAAL